MICKGIYEVLTPSVRLSRFATHVETGRPRKSPSSIHGGGRRVCKTWARAPSGSVCRLRGGHGCRREMLGEEFFELGCHPDARQAVEQAVIVARQLDQLERLLRGLERTRHLSRLLHGNHRVVRAMQQQD